MWYETAVPLTMIYVLWKGQKYIQVAGDRMNWRGITDPRKTPYMSSTIHRSDSMAHQMWHRDAHMATDPWAFKWLSAEWRPITEHKFPYDAKKQW